MRQVTRVSVSGNGNEDLYSRLLDVAGILRSLNPVKIESRFFHKRVPRPAGQRMAGFYMYFDYLSPDFVSICSDLRSQGFSADFDCSRYYSKRDLYDAEYLKFGGGRKVKISGRYPLRREVGEICPVCSFTEGKYRFADARILDQIDDMFCGYTDGGYHKVVTAKLGQRILEQEFKGLEFVHMGDREGKPNWWVLTSYCILPLLARPETLFARDRTVIPPECRYLHGTDYPVSQFSYRRDEFPTVDFSLTQEQFITGQRELIVSNRVYRFLAIDLKLKRLHWSPICLID